MTTINLPAIRHPLSRMDDPRNRKVLGLSRDGSRVASRQILTLTRQIQRSASYNSWRLIRSANGLGQINSPRNNSFADVGQILEGIEIKKAEDPSKPSIPIFGKS